MQRLLTALKVAFAEYGHTVMYSFPKCKYRHDLTLFLIQLQELNITQDWKVYLGPQCPKALPTLVSYTKADSKVFTRVLVYFTQPTQYTMY